MREKTEAAQNTEVWKQTFAIDLRSVAVEYEKAVGDIYGLYCRRTLFKILEHAELRSLLGLLLRDTRSKKTFTCFVKASYNEALQVFFSSGSKAQLKSVEAIVTKIFEFCMREPEFRQYAEEFFRREIVEAGIKTVLSMQEIEPRTLKDYFKS